jgi:hypothetical protein
MEMFIFFWGGVRKSRSKVLGISERGKRSKYLKGLGPQGRGDITKGTRGIERPTGKPLT